MSDFNGRIGEIARAFEQNPGNPGELRYVIRKVLRSEREDGWKDGYSDGQEDHYYGTRAKLEAAEVCGAYEWTGTAADGEDEQGGFTLTSACLAAVVKDRFDCGWRKLVVTRPGGEIVAGIGADSHPPAGAMWWAGETPDA